MDEQDISEIAAIIGNDKKYQHFIKRIKQDFEDSRTKGIPVAIKVFYAKKDNKKAGFCIVSISPVKMREWEKTFKEEGWVENDFEIIVSSFELMYMYIKPEFRREGFAAQLFDKVVTYAQKVGIKRLYAFVSDTDDAALKFYLSKNAKVIYEFSSDDPQEKTTGAFLMWDLVN